MAISVADNFSYKGSKPLDARIQYSTVANMKNATASDLYDGCLAYVTETKKNYQYDSSNTVDPTTGKWRELQTGGGGGGSYTAGDGIVIDNDEISVDEMPTADMSDVIYPLPSSSGGGGGSYTAGDGIVITNDEISTDNATAEDMEEIIPTLPSVMSRLPILFDETGAERVVGWYKYSNGTKKPVYEKSYTQENVSTANVTIDSNMTLANVNIVAFSKSVKLNSPYSGEVFEGAINSTGHLRIWNSTSGLCCNLDGVNTGVSGTVRVTIQYTKTSDTAQ